MYEAPPIDLPEPAGAPHPIVAYVRQLEDALIHIWEYVPGESQCGDCRRIKAFAHELMRARAKELDGRADA